MGDKTGIEWTDATWNPIRGCSRISDGCRHCYAEGVARRFSGPGQPYEGLIHKNGAWNGKVIEVPSMLDQPLRWRKPRRIFVNSMSDLFHEGLTDWQIDRVFAVMMATPWHTFQVLTKRADRMLRYLRREDRRDSILDQYKLLKLDMRQPVPTKAWPLPNVWLGVSVENQAAADERIPKLLAAPAAVRWISAEPLLGPVNLVRWLWRVTVPERTRPVLNWVVAGGESGPESRPMSPGWARLLRDQCQMSCTPFLFKQWGDWAPDCLCATKEPHQTTTRPAPGPLGVMFRCGKKNAGRQLDGALHDGYPEGSP